MPLYEYKALAAAGKQVKGVVEADSARSARNKLKQKGIFPTSLTEKQASSKDARPWNKNISLGGNRVSTLQLAIATRQLATLLAAGMPLVESLRALTDQLENLYLKTVISEVGEEVNEGATLANALSKYPKVFPKIFVNMVSSGEASGTLDMVLERLADLLEGQAALRRKVISALMYPALMILLCIGVVGLLLAFVVPQITKIFTDRNAALPLPTQIVLSLSNAFQNYWHVGIILAVGIALAVGRYYRTESGRFRIDGLLLRLPLIGQLLLKLAASRFSRSLGTMLKSGIEVLRALAIARNVVGNKVLEADIDKATIGVREGNSFAAELKKSGKFPPMLYHMAAVGERTGELDTMLLRAAANYEVEVESFIAGLTSLLEPLLIVFLAVVVGGIIAAVMLPMLELTSLIGV